MKTCLATAALCLCGGSYLGAADRPVTTSQELQNALDVSSLGDTITLQAGKVFSGAFVLPVKTAGSGWITLRGSAQASLPSAGVRVTPAHAALMPKIVASTGNPALAAAPGAHHYRITGIEFTVIPNFYTFRLLEFGSGYEYSISELPSFIEMDQLYIHGDPMVGGKRGISLNSISSSIKNSHISGFASTYQDAQAIMGWNGPGPYEITNNYLEASGENIMFGGAQALIPNLVPSDITIRGNHFSKPLSWRTTDPSYAGTPWLIKNLFELKNARRVMVEGNVFTNVWEHGQSGYAVQLTVRTEGRTCPWAVVEDITFAYNIFRGAGGGINITGFDDDSSGYGRRMRFEHNIFEDLDPARWGGRGWLFQILHRAQNIVIDHNTSIPSENSLYFNGINGDTGFVLENNIMGGFSGTGTAPGISALTYYAPGSVVRNNVLAGMIPSQYPASNFFPADRNGLFVNASGGDYRLVPASLYRNAGTDGRDVGADIATVLTKTAGVLQGASTTTPPASEVSVSVTAATATMNFGSTQPFTATVTGSSDTRVVWSVTQGSGSINTAGQYTAKASGSVAETIAVTAISQADPAKSGITLITVNPVSNPGTPGAASFVKLDTTTGGNWKTVYGGEGYSIANDASSSPAYAVTGLTGHDGSWTWDANAVRTAASQKGILSGRIAATWHGQSFGLNIQVTDGKTHQLALYFLDYDGAGRSQNIEAVNTSTNVVLDRRSITGFGNGVYLVYNISGNVGIRINCTGGVNAVLSSVLWGSTSVTTVPGPSGGAFLHADIATLGTWKGRYGAEGYTIANDASSPSTYGTISLTGQDGSWTWDATAFRIGALQKGAASGRIASTWYGDSFSVQAQVTDGKTHQIALYFVDYDGGGRSQDVDLIDSSTNAVLDHRSMLRIANGVYLVYNISGRVTFTIRRTAGSNAVLSGVFWGTSAAPPSSGGSFSQADTTTFGNWKGKYGLAGYAIAEDASNSSAYAVTSLTGEHAAWIWDRNSSASQALQKGVVSGRIASTWYGDSFDFNAQITDGKTHQIALYFVDYDGQNRGQDIELVDPDTNVVLDRRAITGFGNGIYLVYNISGNMQFRIRRTAGVNAVLSGVFLQ